MQTNYSRDQSYKSSCGNQNFQLAAINLATACED